MRRMTLMSAGPAPGSAGEGGTVRRKVRRRLGIGVAAAAIVGGVVAWQAVPSSATPTTHTITFTNSGVSPSSVTIKSGDSLLFKNSVDPTASVPVLGTATGALRTVTVTVSGASQQRFTVQRGDQVKVGPYWAGDTALVIRYSATYRTTMVAGLLAGPSSTTNGSITVQRSPFSAPRNSGPGSGAVRADG